MSPSGNLAIASLCTRQNGSACILLATIAQALCTFVHTSLLNKFQLFPVQIVGRNHAAGATLDGGLRIKRGFAGPRFVRQRGLAHHCIVRPILPRFSTVCTNSGLRTGCAAAQPRAALLGRVCLNEACTACVRMKGGCGCCKEPLWQYRCSIVNTMYKGAYCGHVF